MKKMKNMNNKGFTLIELLAVITIMGILMMVAIPAVSRTIENSRRDTFGNVAQSYLNAVRNAVLADELICKTATDTAGNTNVAATPDATYYFAINTDEAAANTYRQQTTDLMESGGKSSWGNANVTGYVMWKRTTTSITGSTNTNTKTEYYVQLRDAAGHGTNKPVQDQKMKRQSIAVSGKTAQQAPVSSDTDVNSISAGPYYECKLG